jgi:transketolase
MRDAVARALVELGYRDDTIIVVTADVAKSTRSQWFGKHHPGRLVNVGISEQDMAGFAAGMALAGYKPYMVAFAMFLLRTWEQIRNSIDRMNLDVHIIGAHSGFSNYTDGSSHQVLEDIATMQTMVNMRVYVPADPLQAYNMVHRLHEEKGPIYIRVARDNTPVVTSGEFTPNKLEILRDGSDAALVSAGPLLANCLEAAEILSKEGLDVAVANLHTVKPIDTQGLARLAEKTGLLVVVEEHTPYGGIYGAIAEALAQEKPTPMVPVHPRGYGRSARSLKELYLHMGLDPVSIAKRVREAVEKWRG